MSEAGTIGNGLELDKKRHTDGHPPAARKRGDFTVTSERLLAELRKNNVLLKKIDAEKNRNALLQANLKKAQHKADKLSDAVMYMTDVIANPERHPNKIDAILNFERMVSDAKKYDIC